MECIKCEMPILLDEIQYSNNCNEEGEEYGEVYYWCGCGKDYEYSQWGWFDDLEDAQLFFINEFNEVYGNI